MNKIIFQLQYKNQNGTQNFDSATYRILKSDRKTELVSSTQTDKNGLTKPIDLEKGEYIYLELYNSNLKKFQGPDKNYESYRYLGKGVDDSINILISRTYFQIRLSDYKWQDLNNWKYQISIGGLVLNGTIKNGKSMYFSSDKFNLEQKNLEKKFVDEYKKVVDKNPLLKIKVIDPINNREYIKYERVIPIGSKHEYRDFNIKKIATQLESREKNSHVKLNSSVDYKPLIIYMKKTAGMLYDVCLDNNEIFYDSSWERIKNKKVQDGKAEQLFVPYNYKGYVNIKENGKIIRKISAVKHSSSKYAGPLIYSQLPFEKFKINSNSGQISVTSVGKMKKEIQSTLSQSEYYKLLEKASENSTSLYLIEIDGKNVPQGLYNLDAFLKASTSTCFTIGYGILSSFAWDAFIGPTTSWLIESFWSSKENRQLFWTCVMMKLAGDGSAKFAIKEVRGKLSVVFSGKIIWKKYLNVIHIPIHGPKGKRVAMISGLGELAYDLNNAGNVAGKIKTGTNIIKTGAKGSPFSIIFVASADTLEWTFSDNPEKKMTDLFGSIISSSIKAIISTIAGVVAGVILASISAPALAVIAVGAVTMLIVGAALEVADRIGLFTNGKSWTEITTKHTEYIWEAFRKRIIDYSLRVQPIISNENQEFKFEPLI